MNSGEFDLEQLENLSKKIRKQIVTMVFNSKSSHVGSALSIVEVLVTLYFNILKIETNIESYNNRTDRDSNDSNLVISGDDVKRGQIIARIGETGNSKGPHLHFEIWKNNQVLDPRDIMPEYKQKDVSIR